eukprot:7292859-Pyramimonas_sp.AAC.1
MAGCGWANAFSLTRGTLCISFFLRARGILFGILVDGAVCLLVLLCGAACLAVAVGIQLVFNMFSRLFFLVVRWMSERMLLPMRRETFFAGVDYNGD